MGITSVDEETALLGNEVRVYIDTSPAYADGQPTGNREDDLHESPTKLKCVHFIFLPIIALLYLVAGSTFYLSQQWIQHKVKVTQQVNLDDLNGTSTSSCGATNHSSPSYIAYQKVEESTAYWTMVNSLASTVPSFFGAALISSYSDSLGRRFMFTVGTTSTLLKVSLYAVCIYYDLALIWLVVVTGVDALTGGMYTVISATMSYAADITSAGKSRAFGITISDGVLLLSITASGLVSGFVIQYGSFVTLSLGNAGVALVVWICTVCFLPETHEQKNRVAVRSVCGTFKRMVEIYTSKVFKKTRCAYILLISSFFVDEITSTHRSSIEITYQLGQPFCWTAEKIGIFTAARHATESLASMVLIVPIKACMRDSTIAIWSTVFNTGSYVLEGLATTEFELYLVPVLSTFAFLTIPMVKSMMSTMTPADKQGSLFASIAAVQSICGIVASFMMNQIYASTVTILNGFVFLVLAGIAAIAFVLLVIFALTQKVEAEHETNDSDHQINNTEDCVTVQ